MEKQLATIPNQNTVDLRSVVGGDVESIGVIYPHNHPDEQINIMINSTVPGLIGDIMMINPQAVITVSPYNHGAELAQTMRVQMSNEVVLTILETGVRVAKKRGTIDEFVGKLVRSPDFDFGASIKSGLPAVNKALSEGYRPIDHAGYAETVQVLEETGLQSNPFRNQRVVEISPQPSEENITGVAEVALAKVLHSDGLKILFVHPRLSDDEVNEIHQDLWPFTDRINSMNKGHTSKVIDNPGGFGAFPSKLMMESVEEADVVFQWVEAKRWMVMKHIRSSGYRTFMHHSYLKLD